MISSFEQIKSNGATPQRWIRELTRLLRTEGEKYSAVQALESGAFSGKSGETFEYGLNCILDGIGSPKSRSKRKAR